MAFFWYTVRSPQSRRLVVDGKNIDFAELSVSREIRPVVALVSCYINILKTLKYQNLRSHIQIWIFIEISRYLPTLQLPEFYNFFWMVFEYSYWIWAKNVLWNNCARCHLKFIFWNVFNNTSTYVITWSSNWNGNNFLTKTLITIDWVITCITTSLEEMKYWNGVVVISSCLVIMSKVNRVKRQQ